MTKNNGPRLRSVSLSALAAVAGGFACIGSQATAQPITLLDRITPTSGAANSLVNGRPPITVNSVPWEGYAATVQFSTPSRGGTLSQVRVAYAGLVNSPPQFWTLRFMVWSSFPAAAAGLPGSTASMYNGDVETVSVLGAQAIFAPFGTHSFGGPIYDALVDLAPFNIELAPNTTYVIGFTVFNAGDCGIMETAQTGTPDRGLSPYYSSTGWRWMNSFEALSVGRYAVALRMTPACPADLNNDTQVDDADFSIFVVAYDLLDCADPAMAAGCPADLNADSVVDDADFSLFAVAYDELVCP